jgi:hypothetical protein
MDQTQAVKEEPIAILEFCGIPLELYPNGVWKSKDESLVRMVNAVCDEPTGAYIPSYSMYWVDKLDGMFKGIKVVKYPEMLPAPEDGIERIY